MAQVKKNSFSTIALLIKSIVWLVNSLYYPTGPTVVNATGYDIEGTQIFHVASSPVSLDPDSSAQVLSLGDLLPSYPANATYFLRLAIQDSSYSPNFYWLSTTPDVLDWKESNFYRTPCSSYADFTQLQTLPPIDLDISFNVTTTSSNITVVSGSVANPTPSIAFFVRLRLVQNGVDLLPILWEDNYFSLVPFESRSFAGVTLGPVASPSLPPPTVIVELFNNISGGQSS